MNLFTHLIQTEHDGVIAVTADDPRASELDVVDVAPPGRHFLMASRSPQQMDAEPKARRWVLHDNPYASRRRTS